VAALTKSDIHFNIFGNDKSKKAFNSFNKSTKKANESLKTLRNTIIGAFSIREIVEAGNVMIGVRNRMQAFTGSVEETAKAMDHMKRIAIESRSDFDAVAMLFTRLSLATEHLGATQLDVAKATQMVANTFIIAGSHAQEANNSARQLAQGLASGTLRGDELRSVMENNTILTKMLADGLNMTVGELREFGHAGKLTAETVMPILIAGFEETNELIKDMPMTLGQAGVALRNNFQFLIGDIEEVSGGFSTFSSAVSKIANNIDFILIPALGLLSVAAIKAAKSMFSLAMANPFTALGVAAGIALSAMYIFRDEIFLIGQQIANTFEIAGLKIKLAFLMTVRFVEKGVVMPIQKLFRGMLEFIVEGFNEKIRLINGLIDTIPKRIKDKLGIGNIPEMGLLEGMTPKQSELTEAILETTDAINEAQRKVFEKVDRRSLMDFILGRDPNEREKDGETGFTPLTVLQQFFADAEKGYKDFFTSIKTMQEELQGVFKKTYDGLTNLTMDFLKTGKASFKDFATSVVNELIRIAIQKLILDRMFESFGNYFKSGKKDKSSGGLDIMNNEGGGFTGYGVRAGGVDGRGGFPAILHPNETVVDHTKGQGMGATVNFNISTVDAAGFDELLATRKNMIISMVNQAYNSRGKMGIA
tara:strand:+ start:879 stop:2816 length:1938 start_codon:yes stop_codon:yes gene_type:complete